MLDTHDLARVSCRCARSYLRRILSLARRSISSQLIATRVLSSSSATLTIERSRELILYSNVIVKKWCYVSSYGARASTLYHSIFFVLKIRLLYNLCGESRPVNIDVICTFLFACLFIYKRRLLIIIWVSLAKSSHMLIINRRLVNRQEGGRKRRRHEREFERDREAG